jgi:hypothetical protein
MASPVTTITSSPVIQRLLDELSSCKKGMIANALIVIEKIGAEFKSIEGLPPLSQGRVSYIGQFIQNCLSETKGRSASLQLKNILIGLTTVKQPLQLETIYLGFLYSIILTRCELSRTPALAELGETLPEILHGINCTVNKGSPCFVIAAGPIARYFDRLAATSDTSSLSDDFSRFMLLFFNQFSVQATSILIPVSELPKKEQLEPFLESPNTDCKLISQILYACCLEHECISRFHTVSGLADVMMERLDEIEQEEPRRYHFHEYLARKPLTPLFCSILEERDLYKMDGSSCKKMLGSIDFMRRMKAQLGNDWLEESAEANELIRTIELSLRVFFDSTELAILSDKSLSRVIDPRVTRHLQVMKSFLDGKAKFLKYPDPASILRGSKESFKLLAYYNFWEKEQKELEEIERASVAFLPKKKPIKTPAAKKMQQKAKAENNALPAKGEESATLKDGACPAEEPEEIPSTSPSTGSAHHKDPSTMPHLAAEALQKSKTFLDRILIDPRVAAWNESAAAGLAHYGYGLGAGDLLSESEMVLRHRLPPQILNLLFSDRYSKISISERSPGRFFQEWEGVLEIDCKKYILEATIDPKNILFHFYAKPLRSFADYYHLTKESPSEFPTLSGKKESPIPFTEISTEGITFDLQENAYFVFEGRSYRLILLNNAIDLT